MHSDNARCVRRGRACHSPKSQHAQSECHSLCNQYASLLLKDSGTFVSISGELKKLNRLMSLGPVSDPRCRRVHEGGARGGGTTSPTSLAKMAMQLS